MKKYFILFFVIFCQNAFGQYKISGYLKTDKPYKTVYLSALRFDEHNQMYERQIITSVQTDSIGYFEFKGNLLPKQDQFYRIYSNINEGSLDFIRSPQRRNYHNFIFSNKDTIFFPENSNLFWFTNAVNTNDADKEYQQMLAFENKLRNEFNNTQNVEILDEIQNAFLDRYKIYCRDSIKSPLVSLLAYSRIKNAIKDLNADYDEDPVFYNTLLSKLEKTYGNSSYYLQFREELLLLAKDKVFKKYTFHRNLNYLLLFLLVAALIFATKIFLKNKQLIKQHTNENYSHLTEQERKITELLLQGKSNKEIASALFISLSTVKTHLTNIYAKLKVSNRQQVIAKLKNHTGY